MRRRRVGGGAADPVARQLSCLGLAGKTWRPRHAGACRDPRPDTQEGQQHRRLALFCCGTHVVIKNWEPLVSLPALHWVDLLGFWV